MPKKVKFAGKADHLLRDNPYAVLMQDIVEEDEQKSRKLQLYYALRADEF